MIIRSWLWRSNRFPKFDPFFVVRNSTGTQYSRGLAFASYLLSNSVFNIIYALILVINLLSLIFFGVLQMELRYPKNTYASDHV